MFLEETLEELVVKKLIERGPSTVKELEDVFQAQGDYSQRAIYRALEKLEKATIITKLKSYYLVEIGWLSNFADYWQGAYESQLHHIDIDQLLPNDMTRNVWKLKGLRKADSFWLQIIISLLNSASEAIIYSWGEHPWYFFCATVIEERYLKTLAKTKAEIYRLIGGQSWLDKLPLEVWDNAPGKTAFGQEKGLNALNYVAVIGDYITSIKIKASTAKQIDELFTNSSTNEKLDQKALDLILNADEIVTVEVQRNKKIAQEYKDRILSKFGKK